MAKPRVRIPLLALLLLGQLSAAAPMGEQAYLEKLRARYTGLEHSLRQLRAGYLNLFQQLEDIEDKRVIDIANIAEGRLTTLPSTPITTTSRTNQTTLYFTPYMGNNISLFNGTNWTVYSFSELSLVTSGLTANRNYDVFFYRSAGVNNIELTIWTDSVTRGTALVAQDGVYVRSGATDRRYIGTIRTTSTTEIQDSNTQRFVWNYQNRVPRRFELTEATNSWTYNTDAWRSANNLATNRIEFVIGLAEVLVEVKTLSLITNGTGTLTYYSSGVGLDTTTNITSQIRGSGSDNSFANQMWSEYKGFPPVGYHFLQWVERGLATATTIYGDNGVPGVYASGILGELGG